MSAWYIFSAMGFYPVTPCSGVYAIGTPLFPKVSVKLENGKTFTIEAKNVSNHKYYISSALLNGKTYNKCFITDADIMQGGNLSFTMSPIPDTTWGTGKGDFPVSSVTDGLITPVPSLSGAKKTFTDSVVITLSCPVKTAKIYFTMNGKAPDERSMVYTAPFCVRKSSVLKACATAPGLDKSFIIEATFTKVPSGRKITLFTKYSAQYTAGGDDALIDFIRGGEKFSTGGWQGYEGDDMEAIVDLGSPQPLHDLALGCYQDQGSWIFMPLEVKFSVSNDDKTFTDLTPVKNTVSERSNGPVTMDFTVKPGPKPVRFIKVRAVNRGNCPAWHPGAGKKAWIFVDEIIIR
jgi:hypothetical protein